VVVGGGRGDAVGRTTVGSGVGDAVGAGATVVTVGAIVGCVVHFPSPIPHSMETAPECSQLSP
jgi:hypothetical protein